MIDYKKYIVLYVDDEEKSLKSFSRAFGHLFRILTAPTAVEGFKLLEQHVDEVGLLITDQLMPGEKGVWLLDRVRQLRPDILRILATAYSDIDAVVQAVNTAPFFNYLTNRWHPKHWATTCNTALRHLTVHRRGNRWRVKK